MEYWKTYQKEIILNFLKEALKVTSRVTMWQQLGSHRETYIAQFKTLSKPHCQISIDGKTDLFDNTKPIYIHFSKSKIIFKKDHYNFYQNLIEFAMPGEIQVFDKRKLQRYYYLYQDHKVITYHSELKNEETSEPLYQFSSVLVDISIRGAGIVVTQEQQQAFDIGSFFFLDNITDQKLPDPFKVKVVYKESYRIFEKDLFKIGLSFEDSLDSISFRSIKNIVEKKQRRAEGLSKDIYCGLSAEDQINTLNSIEFKNPVLANNLRVNIRYLDRLRYMTPYMKTDFLKLMNHDLLAIALRLSSKELIFELFSEVTKTMQNEFLEKLSEEKPASGICVTQDQVIKEIKELEKNGTIVLDPDSYTTYV